MVQEASWEECIKSGIITKTSPDKEKSSELLALAEKRIKFWSQKTAEEFIVLKVEAYYDIIKELIFAHLYRKGYNCTNHLCLIAYLEENFEDFDFEIQKIDELRRVRNEINYRVLIIRKDYLERNELEFKNIIKRLKEKLNE